MPIEIGRIDALYRYPVKSMRGERLDAVELGWHGLEGDRRFAFRRLDEAGGFPWLTASKLADLVLFEPQRRGAGADEATPTHVVTPEGHAMPLFDAALAAEVGRRHGRPVELMRLDHGIFDEASLSVITSDTAAAVCRGAGKPVDVRRFRPNILLGSARAVPFEENGWVGGLLTFGDAPEAPAVAVTLRDARCVMVTIDPDDGRRAPEVMKAVVRANQNDAGIYATVTRRGRLAVGQAVRFHPQGDPAG